MCLLGQAMVLSCPPKQQVFIYNEFFQRCRVSTIGQFLVKQMVFPMWMGLLPFEDPRNKQESKRSRNSTLRLQQQMLPEHLAAGILYGFWDQHETSTVTWDEACPPHTSIRFSEKRNHQKMPLSLTENSDGYIFLVSLALARLTNYCSFAMSTYINFKSIFLKLRQSQWIFHSMRTLPEIKYTEKSMHDDEVIVFLLVHSLIRKQMFTRLSKVLQYL